MFADEPPLVGLGGKNGNETSCWQGAKKKNQYCVELKTNDLVCGSYLKDMRIHKYAQLPNHLKSRTLKGFARY